MSSIYNLLNNSEYPTLYDLFNAIVDGLEDQLVYMDDDVSFSLEVLDKARKGFDVSKDEFNEAFEELYELAVRLECLTSIIIPPPRILLEAEDQEAKENYSSNVEGNLIKEGDKCWIIGNGVSVLSAEIQEIRGEKVVIKTQDDKIMIVPRYRLYDSKKSAMKVAKKRSLKKREMSYDYMT